MPEIDGGGAARPDNEVCEAPASAVETGWAAAARRLGV